MNQSQDLIDAESQFLSGMHFLEQARSTIEPWTYFPETAEVVKSLVGLIKSYNMTDQELDLVLGAPGDDGNYSRIGLSFAFHNGSRIVIDGEHHTGNDFLCVTNGTDIRCQYPSRFTEALTVILRKLGRTLLHNWPIHNPVGKIHRVSACPDLWIADLHNIMLNINKGCRDHQADIIQNSIRFCSRIINYFYRKQFIKVSSVAESGNQTLNYYNSGFADNFCYEDSSRGVRFGGHIISIIRNNFDQNQSALTVNNTWDTMKSYFDHYAKESSRKIDMIFPEDNRTLNSLANQMNRVAVHHDFSSEIGYSHNVSQDLHFALSSGLNATEKIYDGFLSICNFLFPSNSGEDFDPAFNKTITPEVFDSMQRNLLCRMAKNRSITTARSGCSEDSYNLVVIGIATHTTVAILAMALWHNRSKITKCTIASTKGLYHFATNFIVNIRGMLSFVCNEKKKSREDENKLLHEVTVTSESISLGLIS